MVRIIPASRGWRPKYVATMPAQSTALGAGAGTANVGYWMLLPQDRPASITKLAYFIGAVGAGDTIDLGLYTFDGTTMTPLITTGSQAAAGSSVVQQFTVAVTNLPDGVDIYAAFSSTGVATVGRIAVTGVITNKGNVHLQKAAQFPLPVIATTTFAASSFAPWIYAE